MKFEEYLLVWIDNLWGEGVGDGYWGGGSDYGEWVSGYSSS